MWDFISKILELYSARKDKFKKAEEKLERRVRYFEELKEIDSSDIDEIQKHARKNGLSQVLVGSPLVSYNLINYVAGNKKIVNFETVAKTLAFWDTCLNIERDQDRNITNISLNQKEYKKEQRMMILTFLLSAGLFLKFLYGFQPITYWLKSHLLLPQYGAIIITLIATLILLGLALFLLVGILVLVDLERIVCLVQRKDDKESA